MPILFFSIELQTILKAYLKGIWDSVKGVSLIFIVIRDTYSYSPQQNDNNQLENELDDSSSSSTNTFNSANKRKPKRNPSAKRELIKLKE